MKTTTEMQLVPITKLVPYVNNARTHSPEQINKLRSSLREFGFINPVIIDRDYGVIAGHGRILAAKEEGIYPKYHASLPTTLPKRRRKPTSLPTTAWRWTQAGMKNSCVWRSSPCRRRTSTRSSPALMKRNCQSCLTTALKPKRMISMWMPNCKSRPLRSPATSGRWGGIGSSAATVPKRKPTPPLWTAARRISLLPTRPTM